MVWRGVIYGTIDGRLPSAFPWLVTWRALGGEAASVPKRAGLGLLALGFCRPLVTSAYHLGYPDFRGPKLVQANVGNAISTCRWPDRVTVNLIRDGLRRAKA